MALMESIWMWALAVSFLSLILYYIGTRTHNHFSKRNVPTLKTVPFFGNMWPIATRKFNTAEFTQHVYNSFRDHNFVGIYQFMAPTVMLRDPELIKLVTVKDFEHFLDHQTVFNEDTEPLFGKSLISLNGHRWKDMRSTLSPVFTSSKMKMMFKLVTECGNQMGEFLLNCVRDKKIAEGCKMEREADILTVEMKDLFTRYTNDVIATSAFGIGIDSLKNPNNDFFKMGSDLMNVTGLKMLIGLGYMLSPRLMKLLKIPVMPESSKNFFRTVVSNTITTREQNGIIRPDMIHLLMQARKGTLQEDDGDTANSMTNKAKLDDDDMTAQVLLFFLAGFETASILMCFSSLQLAIEPDIQTRLQNEIDDQLREDGGNLTYEAINSMKYLDMVISETLRKFPPAVLTDRKCIKKYTLPGNPPYNLEPGQGVWVPIYALHYDPNYFPEPEKFDPERFSEENKDNIKPYTYLPFGSGPRNCIGMRFALMEAKIALVQLLSRFNLKVVSKTPVPIKLSRKKLSMTVDGGFWLGLEERT